MRAPPSGRELLGLLQARVSGQPRSPPRGAHRPAACRLTAQAGAWAQIVPGSARASRASAQARATGPREEAHE